MTAYGKIYDEPIEAYHGGDAVSKSRLDIFRYSPRLYWKRFVAKVVPQDPPTEALLIGSAVDALALDGPEEFDRRFVIQPTDAPKRPTARQVEAKKPSPETLAAIEFWRGFDAKNAGKSSLDSEQAARVKRMADALHSNPEFAKMKAASRPQVTFRVKGARFDVQCRPDLWCEEGCELTQGMPAIFDLKTIYELPCDDPTHLSRHIATFGYHRAAALYRDVVARVMKYRDEYRPPFVLIFVEKDEPHAVVTRLVDDLAIEVGQRENATALMRLQRCHESNVWPESWEASLAPVGLPEYYVRKALEAQDGNLWG